MGTGSGIGGRIRPNTWWSGDTWESHHGSYARTWQGYIPVCPTLQALSPPVVEAYLRRGQGPDLQAGQEGPDPLSDRCHPQGFPWCCPGSLHHWQQDPPYPEG